MRTTWSPTRIPSKAAVTVVLASALALAACTTEASPKVSSPATTVTAAPTTDAAEPTTAPTADGPQILEAGTASVGTPRTVTGTGPATVNFSTEPMNLVFQFSCADCTDYIDVTLDDPWVDLWQTNGPVDGAWLTRPIGAIAKPNSVLVNVDGTWTLTIADAASLPAVTGPQSGRGSAVLTFDEPFTQLDVTFAPFDATDRIDIFVYDAVTSYETFHESRLFDPITETFTVTLPGMVFIRTDGDWTVTPR